MPHWAGCCLHATQSVGLRPKHKTGRHGGCLCEALAAARHTAARLSVAVNVFPRRLTTRAPDSERPGPQDTHAPDSEQPAPQAQSLPSQWNLAQTGSRPRDMESRTRKRPRARRRVTDAGVAMHGPRRHGPSDCCPGPGHGLSR
jgi:hypothetical protein